VHGRLGRLAVRVLEVIAGRARSALVAEGPAAAAPASALAASAAAFSAALKSA
jgi:hypothetical protein